MATACGGEQAQLPDRVRTAMLDTMEQGTIVERLNEPGEDRPLHVWSKLEAARFVDDTVVVLKTEQSGAAVTTLDGAGWRIPSGFGPGEYQRAFQLTTENGEVHLGCDPRTSTESTYSGQGSLVWTGRVEGPRPGPIDRDEGESGPVAGWFCRATTGGGKLYQREILQGAGGFTGSAEQSLLWVDRDGRRTELSLPPADMEAGRVVAGGARVDARYGFIAYATGDSTLTVYDIESGETHRLILDRAVLAVRIMADRSIWAIDGANRISIVLDPESLEPMYVWRGATPLDVIGNRVLIQHVDLAAGLWELQVAERRVARPDA